MNMPFEEYWIGKGIRVEQIWLDYEQGSGYENKYRSMEVHLLQLSFRKYSPELPIFNLEAVLKTSKSVFHNLKRNYLSPHEYETFGPLFVYDIGRGSEKWRFLAEIKPALLFAISLWNQIRKGTARHKAEQVVLIDELRRQFPSASIDDIFSYINSLPGCEEQAALEKLCNQGLDSIQISTSPFRGNIEDTEKKLISFDDLSLKEKK
jgi:hypothetical protein